MKLTKTITYALMHLVVAISVTYALTGSLMAAMSVGLIEPAVQTIFYNLHEKLWATAERGKPQNSFTISEQPTALPC